jgi:hypothetical protein
MSYREWEDDPRNRRGRHSAPDSWLASDETNAGQGRRDGGPGWSQPDRLDDTGAWHRGAHTGEWQRPDEGWPARPDPESPVPAPFLPSDDWATGAGQPWTQQRGSSRSAEGGDRTSRGYERPSSYEPPTYGRRALPAGDSPSYSGEVLPRGYETEQPRHRYREPDPPPSRDYTPRRAIGSANSEPSYGGSSYTGSTYGGASGQSYADSPYRDRPGYGDGPARGERPYGEAPAQRALPARPEPAPYRSEPTYGQPYGSPPSYRDAQPPYGAAAPRALSAGPEAPTYRQPAYREEPTYRQPAQRAEPIYRESAAEAGPPTTYRANLQREQPAYGGAADYRRGAGGPAALPPAKRRASVYDVDDDDEFDDEPESGGYLAAMVYTAMWYAVPMVLWILWSLTLNSEASATCIDSSGAPCESERTEALGNLVDNMPRMGATLLLSIVVAVVLRYVSSSWKAATVGFAAAVVGGGLATVAISVITGQPIG